MQVGGTADRATSTSSGTYWPLPHIVGTGTMDQAINQAAAACGTATSEQSVHV